jgi:hypothetical protein
LKQDISHKNAIIFCFVSFLCFYFARLHSLLAVNVNIFADFTFYSNSIEYFSRTKENFSLFQFVFYEIPVADYSDLKIRGAYDLIAREQYYRQFQDQSLSVGMRVQVFLCFSI